MSLKRIVFGETRAACDFDKTSESQYIKIGIKDQKNIFIWWAELRVPEGCIYSGETFLIEITLSYDYPFASPTFRFINPPKHPFIKGDGYFNMEMIQCLPSQSIVTYLLTILSCLTDMKKPDTNLCMQKIIVANQDDDG